MLQNLKIGTRMLVLIISLNIIGISTVIGLISSKTNSIMTEIIQENQLNMASRYSNEVKAELEIAMDAARTLSNSLSAIKTTGNTNRNMVNQMISEILNRNNNFVGVGVGFEPNAFDGRDAEFSNTIGTDASGRFISYAVRSASGITIEALKGYDKPGVGDWYLKPIASGDESIIDPYPYEINGMKTLITTVVVPIKVGNTNIGVVGIDITLEKLKSITDRIRPYGDGYSFILSNNGVFVTHPKAELVGTNLKELKTLTDRQKSELITSVLDGKINHLEILSAATGLHTSFEYVPIQIGKSKTAWSFGVGVPMDTALKDVSNLTYFAVFVGIIALIIISVAVVFIAKSISKPIVRAMQAAESIAVGELNIDLTTNGKDETARLITAMNTMKISIKAMSDDVQYLTSAGQQGKLDIRVNTDKHKGAYKEIVKDMNSTLDAVIAPLNVAAEYIDRIAKGDIPPKITDEYQGDFNEIKNNLNQCIDSMKAMINELSNTIEKQKEGDVDARCDDTKLIGAYKSLMNGVNDTLDTIISPTVEAIGIMHQYAAGDLSQTMRTLPGKQIVLTEGINNIRENVIALIADANLLSDAAIAGKLDVRADASKHQGDYRKIIEGFNGTLDAVIRPLNVSAEYIDRISKGDIPPKITDNFQGDFNGIKNNLNQCIDAITLLVQDASMLSSSAIAGDLTKRVNAEIHLGDFRKLVIEMNQLMNAISEPIEETSRILTGMSVNDYELTYKNEYKGIWQDIRKSTELAQSRVNNFIRIITNISNGDISDLEPLKGSGKRSENDKLVPAGLRLMESIQGVITAMIHNTELQKLGDIEAFADSKLFPGEYAKLIDGYNEGMRIHINNILGILNLLLEYSNGDFTNQLPSLPGKQIIATDRVNKLRDNVLNLITDSAMLSQAAIEQRFDTRADATKHQGDFRKIVEGVNNTLDTVVDKIYWFEQLLDSIPFPVSVTDIDMNWTFINKSAEQVTGKSRKDVIKTQCSNWGANICKTENCGIALLKKNKYTSFFNQPGMDKDFQVDTQFILNKSGEKIGHIEIVQDVSKITKLSNYIDNEVERMAGNLDKLSKGIIEFNFDIAAADEYTKDAYNNFAKIDISMKMAQESIINLITDSTMLSQAAVQGKLDTRADVSKHQGDFRKIVEGVNNTLDAIIHPLNVSAEYMDRIAKGDIPPRIVDEYRGDFNEIKNNLNQCIDSINLLISDANSLADAAILGDVKKRADIAKHNGDYRKIIKGFNNTLDAVLAPIEESVAILEQMAKGDLSQLMEGEFRGDHAVLKQALNGTLISINELLNQVAETVNQVLTGSSQVANTSLNLSSGASEQAAAIEQMSSSMMEIAAQTKQNAENAMNANKLADDSQKSSERGFNEMQQLQAAMNDINESSKSIAKIIKVIDEIAFQTNLLALNAAVEAARAGVHGQGFAVVAEEVRNLARRSAEAAKETADLIEGSIKKVEVGNTLSGQTAKVLNEIRGQSTIVAGIIRQIAEASNEQATGINQIEIGFSQIDRVTQQNTAGAEESASAAEELASQAQMLEEMLSSFELINAGASHAIAPAKSRKALNSRKYSLNS